MPFVGTKDTSLQFPWEYRRYRIKLLTVLSPTKKTHWSLCEKSTDHEWTALCHSTRGEEVRNLALLFSIEFSRYKFKKRWIDSKIQRKKKSRKENLDPVNESHAIPHLPWIAPHKFSYGSTGSTHARITPLPVLHRRRIENVSFSQSPESKRSEKILGMYEFFSFFTCRLGCDVRKRGES